MSHAGTVRDRVLETFRRRSIQHVFGNPGTTELGLISGLPPDIEYILCLQESIAVGAATGYSLIGGRPAVVNLHALPGVGHAIGALHAARLMHAPVVAIAGQQHSGHLANEPLLSGDLVATARPATRWATEARRPEDVPSAIERAFRLALSPPMGPTLVAVPMDFWDQPAPPGLAPTPLEAPIATPDALTRVRKLMGDSTSGALVTGDQINDPGAWDAAIAVADAYDLDVYAAPIGSQPGFPTDHPRFRGNLPLVSSALSRALGRHDVVVVAGAPVFTVYLYDGAPWLPNRTAIALLTDDPTEAARAPAESIVLGSPGASLESLAEGARSAGYEPRRAEEHAITDLDLASVMQAMASEVPASAVVIDESMTAGAQVRRALVVREPRQYLRTSTGVLGTGLPAAVGAALARPDRRVVAVVGDGSTMFAPQALWTAAQHRLSITVAVLNNGGYESLRGYERAHLADRGGKTPRFDISGIDISALAETMGVAATRITDHASLSPALERAMAGPQPTLLDIHLSH